MKTWQEMSCGEKEASCLPFWKDGRSALNASRALNATSRNAVITVFGRLRKKHGVRAATKSENGRVRGTLARMKRDPNIIIEKPIPKSQAFEPLPGSTSIPLTACGLRNCRWAVDGLYGPSRLFCGDATEAGSSYCQKHNRMSVSKRHRKP